MATRGEKKILSRMKLIDQAVAVVVTNNGQGILTIDDFAHLNDKSLEGIC